MLQKKGRSSKYVANKVSNGNGSSDGVDLEWIPKEHLQQSTLFFLIIHIIRIVKKVLKNVWRVFPYKKSVKTFFTTTTKKKLKY